MSLAKLAAELQGLVEDEDRILIIDVNNLQAMCARLKQVRDQTALLKKEEDRLKRSILAHPNCKIGYSDDAMKVDEKKDFQENETLFAMLKKKGKWEEVTSTKISVTALRAVAEEDKEIAESITWLTSRKLVKRRTKRRAP